MMESNRSQLLTPPMCDSDRLKKSSGSFSGAQGVARVDNGSGDESAALFRGGPVVGLGSPYN